MRRLPHEADSLRNTKPNGTCEGARPLNFERSRHAQAMPAERSGGARRPEEAIRRSIDNMIDGGRAEQRVFFANRQPGDGTENHVTRLRKIHRASGCCGKRIALAALRTRTSGPVP